MFERVLIHFSPVSRVHNPWKRQKTIGFLTFSGGIEMWHWTKMSYINLLEKVDKWAKLLKFSEKANFAYTK